MIRVPVDFAMLSNVTDWLVLGLSLSTSLSFFAWLTTGIVDLRACSHPLEGNRLWACGWDLLVVPIVHSLQGNSSNGPIGPLASRNRNILDTQSSVVLSVFCVLFLRLETPDLCAAAFLARLG